MLAQAEEAGLATSEWVSEGHEGRRFGRLLLHFAALIGPHEDGDRVPEDAAAKAPAPAPAPAGAAAKAVTGLVLSQEDYDALVLEGMGLGVDFSERVNSKERAAMLDRLVKAKRKASASPAGEGSAKKPASEDDLAALDGHVRAQKPWRDGIAAPRAGHCFLGWGVNIPSSRGSLSRPKTR